jgi:uncharacterized membrane protein
VTRTRAIAQAGVIAAVYAGFTLLVVQNPIGYGPVQFRISEALTVLAALTPAAVPGLWAGAVLANLFMVAAVGPVGLLDVVFGGFATLAGAAWTWRWRARTGVALLGPVVANALVVPAYLPIMLRGLGFYRIPLLGIDLEGQMLGMYLFGVVSVGISEALVVYGLGLPLLAALRRAGLGDLAAGVPVGNGESVPRPERTGDPL